MARAVTRERAGPIGLAVLALVAGIVIALVDTSPGWDATGITAGSLLIAAAIVAWLGRDRPWLWALLVGLPTPILGIVRSGNAASLLALVFAGLGAVIGWAIGRLRGS
jgi:hypothetical protein